MSGVRESFSHNDQRVVAVARWMIDATADDDGSPNHTAAMMFAQIVFWLEPDRKTGHPRAKHEHAGEIWLVRSDDEWEIELGMTRKQALRTRRRLSVLGLIECRQMVDGGVKCSHIRRLPIVPETDNGKVPETDYVESGSGTITRARVPSLTSLEVDGEPPVAALPYAPSLADFLAAYPREVRADDRIAKVRTAWMKHARDHEGAVMAGLAPWKKFWDDDATETRFIPYAENFLARETWREEPPTVMRRRPPPDGRVSYDDAPVRYVP